MSHPAPPPSPDQQGPRSRPETGSGHHASADPLFDMRGRVVIVAGAAGGLGRALATALHDRGARLGLLDLSDPDLAGMQRHLPGAMTAAVDIRDEAALTHAVATCSARLGEPDAAINATGILTPAPALDLPEEALRRTLEVNVLGAFLFSRVIARRMMEAGAEGSILHLASVSSMVANEGYAAYSPSKAALSQMVRVLAREWAPEGVRVNAIGPSLAQTDMTRAALADPAHQAETLKLIPMGRFCEGGDLIGPAVMLLSDAGRYITGQTLYVDGGRTLT